MALARPSLCLTRKGPRIPHVGPREIGSREQQRFVALDGQRVRKAITKVERCRMATASEAEPAGVRRARLRSRERFHNHIETLEQPFQLPGAVRPGIGNSIEVVEVWRDASRRATSPRVVRVGSFVRLRALRVVRSAPLRAVVGWRWLDSGRAGTPRGPDQ